MCISSCVLVGGRCVVFVVYFFKQKTAYEMRISDWSSDVCSSDLEPGARLVHAERLFEPVADRVIDEEGVGAREGRDVAVRPVHQIAVEQDDGAGLAGRRDDAVLVRELGEALRVGHAIRQEERRGGKEGVSTCRCGWAPDPEKKKNERKHSEKSITEDKP